MYYNCVILGCGRSGTSMLAGSIESAGYSIGGTGHSGNEGNPKGYFETWEVNNINDTMIFADDRSILTKGSQHGWLARFPIREHPKMLIDTESRIRAVIKSKPFCLKDPRFSYTLPIWIDYLWNTCYICMFRHPGAVINSIMKNCRTAPYLSNIIIDRPTAYDIWRNMYDHILCHARPEWMFLHYNQILDGLGLDVIESRLGINVNKDFPTFTLCRSDCAKDVPEDIMTTYDKLCSMAKYVEGEK